jgi:G3E family GTPase
MWYNVIYYVVPYFQHNKKIAVILNEFGEGVVDERTVSVGTEV